MYRVIDLFAGAGGLSLGFLQTRKYEIKVAYENNPEMQATYKRNHPEVDVRGDVCSANYEEIQRKYGPIDVVIGGPPCQGFSNANRQKNHVISQNNMLVKQYIRAILELQPKAFVMENVSTLRSDVHRFYLDERDAELIGQYDIPMKETKLVLLDREFMFDEALAVVRNKQQISKFVWPEEHYSALNVIYKAAKNPKKMIEALAKHKKLLLKYADDYVSTEQLHYISRKSKQAFDAIVQYYDGFLDAQEVQSEIEPAIMIQRMLSKAAEMYSNHLVVERFDCSSGLAAVIRSFAVFDYLKAILSSKPNDYTITADVLCAANYGAPQKRMRFVVMGIKRSMSETVKLPQGSFTEENYRTVRDAIADLEEVAPVKNIADDVGIPLKMHSEISVLGEGLRDADVLKNHIITNTREIAMERFRALKQGQNFHALDDALKTNTYTDISRTQGTIYLRLDYDAPSGTVVNVRKSMWVHPTLDRAISVREAARLQTFPDSFVFCGSKDKQYQQVGNAVPPIMAKAIAKKLAMQLKKSQSDSET